MPPDLLTLQLQINATLEKTLYMFRGEYPNEDYSDVSQLVLDNYLEEHPYLNEYFNFKVESSKIIITEKETE